MTQEIAPPAFERFAVETPTDERRALEIAQAVAEVLVLAHRHNLALKDFAPDTKGDRIRLEWLKGSGEDFALKLIDWNITGGPEAMAQDLFFFGGHLYYILTGRHVLLDAEGQPPLNLGMGNPAWENLTEGSRRLVSKALHRDPQRRYTQAEMLLADIAWWRDTLVQIDTTSRFRRLDDRLWQARPAGRYDRVLAIADLALRLEPAADVRQSFEQSLKQAREELDKEIWLPIAEALVLLGTRAYEKAALELSKQIKNLPPESEAARLAHIYQLLARVGDLLKQHHGGVDERRTPEWEALEVRAVPALTQRRWRDAQDALAEVTHLRPEMRGWAPLKDLRDWAGAGARYEGEANAALIAAENRLDPAEESWLQTEEEKISAHVEALTLLEVVQEGAPFEPEFKERLALERSLLERRKHFLTLYSDADGLFEGGVSALERARLPDSEGDYLAAGEVYQDAEQKLAAAREKFQAILQHDAAQRRAQIFVRRAQRYREEAERGGLQAQALHQVRQLLLTGEYTEALGRVEGVLQSASDREDARLLHTEAESGARLLREARGSLESAQTYLNNADFPTALDHLRRFESWDGQPLRELVGGEVLSGIVGSRPFRLLTEIRTRAGDLRQRVLNLHEAQQAITRAWEDEDYAEVVARYEDLQTRHALPRPMEEQLEEARGYLGAHAEARALLESAGGFDDLRAAHRLLERDRGRESERLRQQIAEKWLLLAQQLVTSDLEHLERRLREGQRLFSPQSEELFTAMLVQAEHARSVAHRLNNNRSEEQLPTWLGSPDWRTTLARVHEDLEALVGPQSWLELRQQAAGWRAVLEQHVEKLVQLALGQAQVESGRGNFTGALDLLRNLWEGLPDPLRVSLPRDIQDQIQGLRAALEQRLKAESEITRILGRLAREEAFTFREAAVEVERVLKDEQFARHERVSLEDLQAQLHLLQKLTEMELALNSTPVPELSPAEGQRNYAQIIHACRRASDVKVGLLADHSESLGKRLANLPAQLRNKANETTRALFAALQVAVREQRQHPESAPRRLLDLYAQARWVEALSATQHRASMDEARSLPRYTLKRAAEALAQLHDLVGDQVVEEPPAVAGSEEVSSRPANGDLAVERGPLLLLRRAETLNNELHYLPSDRLPPLPENVHPTVIPKDWQLPVGPLTALNDELIVLKKVLHSALRLQVRDEPVVIPQPEVPEPDLEDSAVVEEVGTVPAAEITAIPYDDAEITTVQSLARDVEKSIKRLHDLWKALDLSWQEDSNLAELLDEAEGQQVVAKHLVVAHQHLLDNQAMQGLDSLYATLEASGLMDDLAKGSLPWLAQPRQVLKMGFGALRQELVGALGRQVADILDRPDAVEALQQQILVVPSSRWLADAAYQAIYQGVDRRAKQAEAEGRKDAAQRLWKMVLDATAPWADQASSVPAKRGGKPKARSGKASTGSAKNSPPPPATRGTKPETRSYEG
jgi:hypothetical protein